MRRPPHYVKLLFPSLEAIVRWTQCYLFISLLIVIASGCVKASGVDEDNPTDTETISLSDTNSEDDTVGDIDTGTEADTDTDTDTDIDTGTDADTEENTDASTDGDTSNDSDTATSLPVQAIVFDSVGNSNGLDFTTGWEFSISAPITVTHLGHVDMDNNGIENSAEVGIWSLLTNTLLSSVTVTSKSSAEVAGVGSSFYEPITPLDLGIGNYIVAAQRNGENFYFDTPHTTAPGINWIAGRAASAGPLPMNASDFTITRTDTGSYFGANFKFTGAGVNSLSLSEPLAKSVLQRDGSNRTDIPIRGTYSGTPSRIEARAVPRAGYSGTPIGWQAIENAPTDGVFSTVLPNVPGGWYDVEVRTMEGTTPLKIFLVEQVGVGEIFIMTGQSNSANYGSPVQIPTDERICAPSNQTLTSWQHAKDPQPNAGGSGGSPWPKLAELIVGKYDIPVGIVSVGVGSTTVSQWMPGSQNYESKLKPILKNFGKGGFRAILWHQGESDSLAKTPSVTYAESLQAIIDQSRQDAGFNLPWGVALASWHPNSAAPEESDIIAGQQTVIANDPLVFEGASTNDFHTIGFLHDSVHFNQSGLDEHAQRWFAKIEASSIIP